MAQLLAAETVPTAAANQPLLELSDTPGLRGLPLQKHLGFSGCTQLQERAVGPFVGPNLTKHRRPSAPRQYWAAVG